MKKSISKLLCALALSAVLSSSAFAAGNDLDMWVSKLFPLPTPTVSASENAITVTVANPGAPYGLDCQIGTALYDKDGRMLDTKFVVADSSESFTFTFAANENATAVKLFLFEASSGFRPIYEAKAVEIK